MLGTDRAEQNIVEPFDHFSERLIARPGLFLLVFMEQSNFLFLICQSGALLLLLKSFEFSSSAQLGARGLVCRALHSRDCAYKAVSSAHINTDKRPFESLLLSLKVASLLALYRNYVT